MTPTITLFSWLLHNCTFAAVMNHSANICFLMILGDDPSQTVILPQRLSTRRLRTTALGPAVWTEIPRKHSAGSFEWLKCLWLGLGSVSMGKCANVTWRNEKTSSWDRPEVNQVGILHFFPCVFQFCGLWSMAYLLSVCCVCLSLLPVLRPLYYIYWTA